MNYIKPKCFCTAEETISKMKRQFIVWKDIFTSDISDKGLVSKMYKELINSTENLK